MEVHRVTAMACIDLSAAFDTANHACEIWQNCARPSLYSVYASTVSVRVPHNLEIHRYADDHAIKTSYTSGFELEKLITRTTLEETMLNI